MTYAIVNQNHGYTLKDLSLEETARQILTHDGCEFDIRPSDLGYDLWYRQQVANIKWIRSSVYSIEDDLEKAHKDIYLKVISNQQRYFKPCCLDVMTMDEFKVYEKDLEENLADE